MARKSTLIFIPTYNEHENVQQLYKEIKQLGLDVDILFMDDNSPDGTGEILDRMAKEHQNITILHHSGKLGVGSAHLDGIRWAYQNKYTTLITMDCDFTHSPEYIPEIMTYQSHCDVAVGSRYLKQNSLRGWNLVRKFLTNLGHILTVFFLGLPYDATGAFRLYRLDKVPSSIFDLIQSKGYSFFFESLYVIYLNRFTIKEMPIALPPRLYGHSKMTWKEIVVSLKQLVRLYSIRVMHQKKYLIKDGKHGTA